MLTTPTQPPTDKSVEDYLLSLESKLVAIVGDVQKSFNTNLLTAFGLAVLLTPHLGGLGTTGTATVFGFTPEPSFAIPFVSALIGLVYALLIYDVSRLTNLWQSLRSNAAELRQHNPVARPITVDQAGSFALGPIGLLLSLSGLLLTVPARRLMWAARLERSAALVPGGSWLLRKVAHTPVVGTFWPIAFSLDAATILVVLTTSLGMAGIALTLIALSWPLAIPVWVVLLERPTAPWGSLPITLLAIVAAVLLWLQLSRLLRLYLDSRLLAFFEEATIASQPLVDRMVQDIVDGPLHLKRVLALPLDEAQALTIAALWYGSNAPYSTVEQHHLAVRLRDWLNADELTATLHALEDRDFLQFDSVAGSITKARWVTVPRLGSWRARSWKFSANIEWQEALKRAGVAS